LLHCLGNHQLLRFIFFKFDPSLHTLDVVVVLLDNLCFFVEMLNNLLLFDHLSHDLRHLPL